MASLIALSYIAKSLVSKVYEFDSKRHKLKPGDNLVVTGRGKPKLVMTKDEYVEHKLNHHKREFREGAHKRGYTTLAIDPNHNPQFANMLRHEIKTGRPSMGYIRLGNGGIEVNEDNGAYSLAGIQRQIKTKAPKGFNYKNERFERKTRVPLHDSKAMHSVYDTSSTKYNRQALDRFNEDVGHKPKKGSMSDVIHNSKHAVKGIHYGGKPKMDHEYKIYYTQNMVDEEVNRHTYPLEDRQAKLFVATLPDPYGRRKPLTKKQLAAHKAEITSLQKEIDMHNKKAVKHQKYVNDLVGHSNRKLKTHQGLFGGKQ
jgi:hypothetical protein